MRRLLIALVLFMSGCASLQPPADWTAADTRRQLAYSAALAADAITTGRIHDHPNLVEGSPIARMFLGKRPEPAETYVAAALLGLGHYWLSRRMKPERRKIFQYFAFGAHTLATRQNCDNGLC